MARGDSGDRGRGGETGAGSRSRTYVRGHSRVAVAPDFLAVAGGLGGIGGGVGLHFGAEFFDAGTVGGDGGQGVVVIAAVAGDDGGIETATKNAGRIDGERGSARGGQAADAGAEAEE